MLVSEEVSKAFSLILLLWCKTKKLVRLQLMKLPQKWPLGESGDLVPEHTDQEMYKLHFLAEIHCTTTVLHT